MGQEPLSLDELELWIDNDFWADSTFHDFSMLEKRRGQNLGRFFSLGLEFQNDIKTMQDVLHQIRAKADSPSSNTTGTGSLLSNTSNSNSQTTSVTKTPELDINKAPTFDEKFDKWIAYKAKVEATLSVAGLGPVLTNSMTAALHRDQNEKRFSTLR